ncbi:MAG: hypothetical protein R2715_01350 [Ilumatobacteraceae bacterium]
MIVDCDRIWSALVTAIYKLRRKPRTSQPPRRARSDRSGVSA